MFPCLRQPLSLSPDHTHVVSHSQISPSNKIESYKHTPKAVRNCEWLSKATGITMDYFFTQQYVEDIDKLFNQSSSSPPSYMPGTPSVHIHQNMNDIHRDYALSPSYILNTPFEYALEGPYNSQDTDYLFEIPSNNVLYPPFTATSSHQAPIKCVPHGYIKDPCLPQRTPSPHPYPKSEPREDPVLWQQFAPVPAQIVRETNDLSRSTHHPEVNTSILAVRPSVLVRTKQNGIPELSEWYRAEEDLEIALGAPKCLVAFREIDWTGGSSRKKKSHKHKKRRTMIDSSDADVGGQGGLKRKCDAAESGRAAKLPRRNSW